MKQPRILIVGDDPESARLLENGLRSGRYQCVGTAPSGQEAIALADSTRPDLVLMELALPGELDGIQTAAILLERFDIPALYLTPCTDEALCERAREAAPYACLSKPFNDRELARAIEAGLDRHALLRRLQATEARLAETQAVAQRTADLDATTQRLQAEISTHQQTEKNLWHSESRYRSLVENLPDAVFVIQDDRVIFANPAALRLAGVPTPDELLGKTLADLAHPDSQKFIEARMQAALSSKKTNPKIAYSFLHSDGSAVEVESISFAFEYDGRPAFLGVVHDLTERRRIEREAERFRVALDSSADAIFLIDPTAMRIIDANQTACASLGYSHKELLERGPHDIKPFYNKTLLREHFDEVLAGKPGAEMLQTVHQRKDGSTFPVEVSLRPFESDECHFMVVVARDVTARQLAEVQLKESNERFQQFAENVNEVFWIRDLDEDRFLYVSPAYETVFRKPVSSMYRHPRSFLSVVHPADLDRVTAAFAGQRQRRQGVDLEYRIIVGDNEIRWLWVRTFPIRDEQGKVYRMAGVAEDVTQRRESEEQYRSIVQTSMDGFLIVGMQGQILDCNEAFCGMLAYPRDEMLQLSIPDLEDNESSQQVAEHIQRIIEGKRDRFETRHQHKNGQLIDLEVSAHYQPDSKGGKLFAFFRDITQRKQAEHALRESELRYRSLIANLPGIAYRCNLDAVWSVMIFSGNAKHLTGYPPSDFLDNTRTYASIIHPDDTAMVERMVRESVAKHSHFEIEYRIRHADGRIITVQENGHAVFDEHGEVLWLDGFIWDITERKLAEQAQRRSEARSRSILRAAPVGIGVLVDRVFLEVNDTMTRMTGYSAEELIGQSARMLYPTQADFDYVGTEKYRQIHTHSIGTVETRWRRKDGSIIDVLLSSSPIELGDPSLGVTFTALDITATKQAEQERLAHEARLRDALVREVHHRIKNNLQGVIGLLLQHIASHPDTLEPIEAAIAHVNTIAVVHGLQSRVPENELLFCELLHEVSHAAGTLARVSCLPAIEDALAGDVWLDSYSTVTIALILNELIHNAIKHSGHSNGAGVDISLSGDTQRVMIRIRNPGKAPLPDSIDLSTGQGCGTGLDLVRTLLPRRGAELNLYEIDGYVTAELVLSPPVTSTHGHIVRTPGQARENP